jgi:integrase
VKVRDRSIEADLVALHTMLNFGARERDCRGRRLIAENPLRGVAIPKEKNPKRPVVLDDEYEKLVAVSPEIHSLLEVALVIAEGTGRRLSAFRQLRWQDVDFESKSILWAAETDKKGYRQAADMTEEVRAALLKARSERPAIGAAWVFPSPKDPKKPCSRHLLDDWLRRAYAAAKITPPDQGMWHPFRRRWATRRKGHSATDIAAAGGWRDVQTLYTSYLQADADSIRNVVLTPTHRLAKR